jgi:hypothetical protein
VAWTILPVPDPAGNGSLNWVSCSSATACTAVGEASTSVSGNHVTLAERWNGTAWAIQPTPGNPAAAPR